MKVHIRQKWEFDSGEFIYKIAVIIGKAYN